MQRVRRQGRKRSHLITGTARLGKKNAGAKHKNPVFDPVSQCEPVPHLRIESGEYASLEMLCSIPPAGQKAAPAAGLARHGTHLFREFIGHGFIIIYSGIVGRPDNGDDRQNAGRDVFGNVLARTKQRRGRHWHRFS